MDSLSATIIGGNVSVTPGGSAQFAVEVRNLGTVVDRYRCDIVGVDAIWVTVVPSSIELFPNRDLGERDRRPDEPPTVGRFTVTVHPPREPEALARQWPVGALVASEHDPSNRVVEETTITILPFGALEASLHPVVISGRLGAATTLELTNRGNRPEEVSIVANDPAERIDFKIDRTTLSLGPGERARIRLRLSKGGPDLIGGVDTRPFTVDVRARSRDLAPPSLAGRFEKHAFLPTGLPAALATIAALAMGGVALWAVIGLGAQKIQPPQSAAPSFGLAASPGAPIPTAAPATQPPPTQPPPPPATPEVTDPPTAAPVTPAPVRNHLAVDDELLPGDRIVSNSGIYQLTLQLDGNLVLTRTDRSGADAVLWAPKKFREVPARWAVLQADGNFVLYESKPATTDAVWATGTADATALHQQAGLVVQDDGNLVVFWGPGLSKWASRDDPGCQHECSGAATP
jgi:hypothetical protein